MFLEFSDVKKIMLNKCTQFLGKTKVRNANKQQFCAWGETVLFSKKSKLAKTKNGIFRQGRRSKELEFLRVEV